MVAPDRRSRTQWPRSHRLQPTGLRASDIDYAGIVEEVSSVDGSVGLALAAHNSLGSNHIFQFGNEAQRRKYIPKLASGQWLAAWGLTEAEAGSDSGGTKTTAVRDDGPGVLNGSKNFITNASVAGSCTPTLGPNCGVGVKAKAPLTTANVP